MMKRAGIFLLAVLLVTQLASAAEPVQTKIRTITAFVSLEAATAEASFRDAAEFLKRARTGFQAAGWEVQSLRVATPPMDTYLRTVAADQRLAFLLRLDALAAELGLALSLGPVIVRDEYEVSKMALAVELLRRSRVAHTSVVIADASGLQPEALRAASEIIRRLGEIEAAEPPSFRFAALANCPPRIPFFPAAYAHSANKEFAVGLESAGTIAAALAHRRPDEAERAVWDALAPLGQLKVLAEEMAEGEWTFVGIDTAPAPMGEVSIGAAIERLSGVPFGSAGTLAAVARLTEILKALPVVHTGFSGLMLPVLEDSVLAKRAGEGRVNVQLLLTYSAVSGTGLDVVPLPGETTAEQIARLLRDVAALALRLGKPLTARLLLVPGKRAGEMTEFDSPWLTNTRVLPIE
ncbi:MAG: DUF711 family protein [Terriglobia bacterium]